MATSYLEVFIFEFLVQASEQAHNSQFLRSASVSPALLVVPGGGAVHRVTARGSAAITEAVDYSY